MDQEVASLSGRLRGLRLARRVTLSELAVDTGYSEGYLSRVENAKTIPSISALSTVAAALGTDLTAFFPREHRPRASVARAGDAQRLRVAPNAHEEYIVLKPRDPDAPFTALTHRVFPDEERVRSRHVGERFALLLHGEMVITIGSAEYRLGPGDTIHYSSHPELSFKVTSNEPAEILWLVSPAIL
jgi:transcriptional regulator with XRE-family HTH domain